MDADEDVGALESVDVAEVGHHQPICNRLAGRRPARDALPRDGKRSHLGHCEVDRAPQQQVPRMLRVDEQAQRRSQRRAQSAEVGCAWSGIRAILQKQGLDPVRAPELIPGGPHSGGQ
jgi:hypothetical protein